jgi:hypothetical protein
LSFRASFLCRFVCFEPFSVRANLRVPAAMSGRSRSRAPRGAGAEIAALREALRLEREHFAALEARWLAVYHEVVEDARALAALARAAGAAGDVVDDWFVPPPAPAEPEPEPEHDERRR